MRDLPGQRACPGAGRAGLLLWSIEDACATRPGLPDLADEGARRFRSAGVDNLPVSRTTVSRFRISPDRTGAPVYDDVHPDLPRPTRRSSSTRSSAATACRDRPRRLVGDAARLRVFSFWSLERARRHAKAELLRTAMAVPGLIGALAGVWNARDGEYAPGRSKLLHLATALRPTATARPFRAAIRLPGEREREASGTRREQRAERRGLRARLHAHETERALARARLAAAARSRARRRRPLAAGRTLRPGPSAGAT